MSKPQYFHVQHVVLLQVNLRLSHSILYKTKLPIVVVFNKSDIADANVPINWMQNFDQFMVCQYHHQDEIRKGKDYLSTLSRSMALALDEFYTNLTVLYLLLRSSLFLRLLEKGLTNSSVSSLNLWQNMKSIFVRNEGTTNQISLNQSQVGKLTHRK